MRNKLLNKIVYFPMKIFCCVIPLIHALVNKRVYIPHYYVDEDDKYIHNQSVLITPTSFRVVKPNTKPRKNEERIDNVTLIVMTCHFCGHQETMWLREGNTLKDLPEIKVKLGMG